MSVINKWTRSVSNILKPSFQSENIAELQRNAEDERSIIFSLSFKDDFIRGDKKKSENQISTRVRDERLSEDKARRLTRDKIRDRLLSMGLLRRRFPLVLCVLTEYKFEKFYAVYSEDFQYVIDTFNYCTITINNSDF